MKKHSYFKIVMFAMSLFFVASIASAAEDINTGKVLAVGKVNDTYCMIRVEGATFPNTCSTAVYQTVYFPCTVSEGKEFLSIGVAAYIAGKPVRIHSEDCSPAGSSVANLITIYLGNAY
jgi:hypothetical protein